MRELLKKGYLPGMEWNKPVGDLDLWPNVRPELRRIFPLDWTPAERDLCNETRADINKRRFAGPQKTIAERFLTKHHVRTLIYNLTEDPAAAIDGIRSISPHLQGGPHEKLFYPYLTALRNDSEARRLVEPSLDCFTTAACEAMTQYVKSGNFTEYRTGFALVKTIVRIDPVRRADIHKALSLLMAPYREDRETHFFLPSVLAWEADPKQTHDGDIEYLEAFDCELESPAAMECGASSAFFNAPHRIGWGLIQLTTTQAKRYLNEHPETTAVVVQSFVSEIRRKCRWDSNHAWLACRFLKLHSGLHYLLGKHPYRALQELSITQGLPDLKNNINDIVRHVSHRVEWAKPEDLPPKTKTKLTKILGGLQWLLKRAVSPIGQKGAAP